MNEDSIPVGEGGDNTADEVNPTEEMYVEDSTEEELSEGESSEEEESPVDELPAEEPVVEELQPRANIPLANNARDFSQRHIFIRYAVTDNPDRGSRSLPSPKHLIVSLPKALAQLFAGVWVAERDEEVLLDFFARSEQNDRKGYKIGDPWKWIKIKPNGEIAVGISRPFTRARADGVLERDYKIGAFKLVIPLVANAEATERAAEDQPTPMFG